MNNLEGNYYEIRNRNGAALVTMFLVPQISYAQVPVGRWEIVHTSGDNSAQTDLYPGSFSTFLRADGTGYTYGTFSSSVCVLDPQTFNVVPTWAFVDTPFPADLPRFRCRFDSDRPLHISFLLFPATASFIS